MKKVIMQKANRQIKVDSELKEMYLQRGYDEIDEKGKVVTGGNKKNPADYQKTIKKLQAENEALKAENEALKAAADKAGK